MDNTKQGQLASRGDLAAVGGPRLSIGVFLRGPWPLFTALFVFCLVLYSRHNTFPYYYHPDEPGKAEQIVTHTRDFQHPQLMLTAAQIATAIARPGDRRQKIVVVGRWVCALFTSLAVAMLAVWAFRSHRWLGVLCVGALGATCHRTFEFAHYMKEDAALLFGLALFFVAADFFWRRRNLNNIAFLGIACAVAMSGKYIGCVALLAALPLIVAGHPKNRRSTVGQRIGTFLVAMLCALALINYPIAYAPGQFLEGLRFEVVHGVTGHYGLTRHVPHGNYWVMWAHETTTAVKLLVVAHLIYMALKWRKQSLPMWLVTGFPFAYTLVLSMTPHVGERYLLPTLLFSQVLAGIGLVEVGGLIPFGRLRRAAVIQTGIVLLILGVALAQQIPQLVEMFDEFRGDSRAQMVAWIERHLPERAVIAQDTRVNLPDPTNLHHRTAVRFFKQTVISRTYVADLGTIQALRQGGITHVAVTAVQYGRLFHKDVLPTDQSRYLSRRRFYQRLFEDGKLLWHQPPGSSTVLHPGLRLYKLSRVRAVSGNNRESAPG